MEFRGDLNPRELASELRVIKLCKLTKHTRRVRDSRAAADRYPLFSLILTGCQQSHEGHLADPAQCPNCLSPDHRVFLEDN